MADTIISPLKTGGQDLLDKMEVQFPGYRNADGSISCVPFYPFRSMMFGPFLRLEEGRYSLDIAAMAGPCLWQHDPVIGVEIIMQNRFLRAFRDFTPAELNRGLHRIEFDVPHKLSIESGVDAPCEFRVTGFGAGRVKVQKLALARLSAASTRETSPMIFRMQGRWRPLRLPGSVSVSPLTIGAITFNRSLSSFYLPAGMMRLDLAFDVGKVDQEAREVLDVRLLSQDGQTIASEIFSGEDILSGKASFLFEVPFDISYDGGTPQRLRLDLRHFRNVWLKIRDISIVRPSETIALTTPLRMASPRPQGDGKKRILIFGNCQAGILSNAMRDGAFSKHFTVKHHFMELPANLHEQGRRDLDRSDILLIQDIREWENYPLKDYVPDTVHRLRYPCIRFASPWPFDAFNGPDDRLARDKDFPNFEFTYFDGLLARLRQEIPNPEARLEAYRTLAVTGVIDPKRLHRFEEKRLRAMDEKFDTGIGAYILENFRDRPLFYTTAHPNGTILRMLLKYLSRQLDVRDFIWPSRRLDSLRYLQVPVHPVVARALELKWAKDDTLYRVHGRKVRWEEYFRKYIMYYG
ncbi:WcbI family polysaccharide biosynthesis putative acetyltransferase [Rhizobium sp. SL86]|uniref:WcbI family polysaccharide biosynthesis putative acetyltransferase n=1 Tax=Rhizobium sp. SL86 TaxID=2995148 RepID=UPI002275625C|nr:WcbI family polysaccharide biosynthesis putative acetyltransferase [Rhizobium sp. SL86]MCY1669380.1 WcbI family polysaccharide biosynthesis putative acetyltransferase [Rhizobium sp. SL86]